MGLLSYPPHGPLDRVNWVLPFWVDARGQDALLGLPLFWGLVDGPANGAYFQTLSAAPSPCVRTAWARAVIVPASIAISTCLFGLTLIAVISRMLIMTLWVSRLSFLFDDLFGFELLWSPNFLFIWCFCVWLSSGFLFVYLASGPLLECFFFHLILGPAASPSRRAFSTGTTWF